MLKNMSASILARFQGTHGRRRLIEALRLQQIVADEETLAAIAAKAPLAIKIGKPALASAEDRDLESALDYLCLRLGDVIETEDAKEGLTAFMQKRKPVWKGR